MVEDVNAMVGQWLQLQPKEFFAGGTYQLECQEGASSTPGGEFSVASKCLLRAVPSWVSFEQALCIATYFNIQENLHFVHAVYVYVSYHCHNKQ